jgi:hypothetical protein
VPGLSLLDAAAHVIEGSQSEPDNVEGSSTRTASGSWLLRAVA